MADMEIVHEFDNTGAHRLVIDGKEGMWSGYRSIADGPPGFEHVHGTTEYYEHKLPAVFVIEHETKHTEREVQGRHLEGIDDGA